MPNDLQTLISQWKNLPRNNPAELATADNFFDQILMPRSKELFLQKRNGQITNYDGMVLTLGTSWQPLALSISALHPAKVLFLGTADTQKFVPIIQEFVNSPETIYETKIVSRSSAADIYAACREWERQELATIAVDITGGTKAMVSALAMFAAIRKWDIYYVESKYLPLYRRPEPGSEELVLLPAPK